MSLNWTKVGLKATISGATWGLLLSLNWTKVGLKADVHEGWGYGEGRLNWTKVGLKGVSGSTSPKRDIMFELD